MDALISKESAAELNTIQQQLYAMDVPVMIIFEGSSGKVIGRVMNEIMRCLEPRGVSYEHFDPQMKGARNVFDFLEKSPPNGMIGLYDRSWYSVTISRYDGDEEKLGSTLDMVRSLEEYFVDNGVLLIKVLLRSTPEALKEYGDQYSDKTRRSFLSTDNVDPVKFRSVMIDSIYKETDYDFAPWDYITVGEIGSTVNDVVKALKNRLEARVKHEPKPRKHEMERKYDNPRMGLDLNKECDSYKKRLAELSDQLGELQSILAISKKSLVLGFEGWDAAGKGTCIKHLCHALNPRGYKVHQTKAPNPYELAHTYLWRFCDSLPESGHITVYDRTWYGRMMVEPIEDLCSEDEYVRSADEINTFEKLLTSSNTIVIKFWLDITSDEQASRFKDRTEDPLKQWKITDEDWRNRSKWDQYDEYVNAMIESTNTPYAPWVVVEAMDKKYARVKVLETVVDTLKKELLDPIFVNH